jgi:integration host factor subunit beta
VVRGPLGHVNDPPARLAAKEGCLTCLAILATFRTTEGFTLIKSELVDRISIQNPHLYRHDAEKIVNAIFSEIAAAMARGDRVELRGFGVFFVRVRAGRTGRNPRTGAQVSVGSKAVPLFRSGKEMKSLLNSYAHGSDINAGRRG